MKGQYTEQEMIELINQGITLTDVKTFIKGKVVIKKRKTINYYRKCSDNTWENYDCKTTFK